MSTERDTHFANFARLLWEEMLSQSELWYIDVSAGHIPLHHPEDEEHQRYIQVIARRAYDFGVYLANHWRTSNDITLLSADAITLEVCMQDAPDMTSFPPEQSPDVLQNP